MLTPSLNSKTNDKLFISLFPVPKPISILVENKYI